MKETNMHGFGNFYKTWKIIIEQFDEYSNKNSAYMVICRKVNTKIWESSVVLDFTENYRNWNMFK
jgi:hypothetical protein